MIGWIRTGRPRTIASSGAMFLVNHEQATLLYIEDMWSFGWCLRNDIPHGSMFLVMNKLHLQCTLKSWYLLVDVLEVLVPARPGEKGALPSLLTSELNKSSWFFELMAKRSLLLSLAEQCFWSWTIQAIIDSTLLYNISFGWSCCWSQ